MEKRKSYLYLYSRQKEQYVRELRDNLLIYTRFVTTISMDDFNLEATEYVDKRFIGEMDSVFNNDNQDAETFESEEDIYAEGFRYYNLLIATKYRLLLSWISCTRQLWEQQVLSYVIREIEIGELYGYSKSEIRSIKKAQDIFRNHGIDFEKMSCWNKIQELGYLVNVIKHSEGQSEEELRKMRPDFFNKDENNINDDLSIYHTTLGAPTLNIKESEIETYTEALVDFWNKIPTDKHLIKVDSCPA